MPANGRARADIDLHDKPLAGRVLRFHQPFSGAVVTVTRTQLRNRVVARTRTDVDGRFRLQIPGNSDVSVSVSSPGGVPIVGYSASASDPGARATWNSGNLTMDWEPRRVTGRILTKAGLPVADLPLRLDPNEGVEAGRTAADGTYAIDAPTYAFRLYVGDGKSWPFPPYSNSSHAIKARDWTLPEIPAQIHGRVRFARLDGSPGDPIPNAWVRLNAKNSRLLQTDSDGRFRFDGQPSGAGALDVLPAAPQNSWAPTLPAVPIASSRVNVKSGAIVNVDLVVPAGWIDVDAAVAGRSLIPQRIFIARAEAPQANRERVKFTMDPDDEGRLAALVPPGEYVVEYAPEADLLAPGVGTQLASRLVATVVVKPGERSPVHLVAGLLRPAWIADLRGAEDRPYRVNAGAARVGDLVIIGGEDGMLTAVRAKGAFGGTIAWRASLGGAVRTRPLAVGSRLFVATDDGLLHAFDIDERTPRHEALGYPVRLDAPLFVDLIWRPRGTGIDPLDGEVVAAGGGDSPALLVIDGRTGSILARHPLPSPPTAAPAIVGDQVVVPVAGRRMIAVDAKGSTTWEREFGRDNPGGRGPAVDLGNGLLVQGSDRGMIEALDSKTGAVPPSWPANSSSSLSASGDFVGIRDTIVPTANHRTLLAAAGNRGVLAVATSNGESDPLWPWTNPDPYGSPNRNPLRFSSAPLALVAVDGTERFCSTAILEPGGDLLDSLAVPILQSVSARLLSGVATFDPTERNGYGVLICAPMETPGNNYTAFYGDHTDRFIGRPVATGSGPEDSVVVVTEAGRVYGFSALGPQ